MFAHNKGVRSYVQYRTSIIFRVFRVHIIDAAGAASEVLKAVQQIIFGYTPAAFPAGVDPNRGSEETVRSQGVL